VQDTDFPYHNRPLQQMEPKPKTKRNGTDINPTYCQDSYSTVLFRSSLDQHKTFKPLAHSLLVNMAQAANAGASTTSLQFRHVFGVNTNVVDNVSYTDDDTIVYVAGHSLVLYSLTEKRQRFIQSSEITESITAYTSGSGKRLAAVAERGENPSFHIFDLRTFRRKKSVTTSDILSKVPLDFTLLIGLLCVTVYLVYAGNRELAV
jgi:hypothetical protein